MKITLLSKQRTRRTTWKNNFNQDAVNRSLDEAAQNPEQFDEDGDGKIEDSERTVTTDLLESQGRLKIYGEEDSEEEQ